MPTIGVDFGVRSVYVPGFFKEVRINFWDVSGAAEYVEVRNELFRENLAQGIVLVFDITDRQSFENVQKWFREAASNVSNEKQLSIFLVGNKIDKVNTKPIERQVSELEAKSLARKLSAFYFEASVNTGANVMNCFNDLFAHLANRFLRKTNPQ